MLFKDWRFCSIAAVPLPLVKGRVYYIHAKAWALKGYLGGTHSWCTFWSDKHKQWLVVELTDPETVSYQDAKILYAKTLSDDVTEHSPMITTRLPNQQWFGGTPVIVDSCIQNFTYDDLVNVCSEYPIDKFVLINRNCNTFISYLVWRLNLNWKRPLRSIGFRSRSWWSKF